MDDWLNNLPPLDYERRYMPEAPKGQIVGNALMGEAFEELGQKESISTDELDSIMNEAFDGVVDSSVLDLNKDKKVDLAEYSTTILLADMLSTDKTELSFNNVTGTTTNEGETAALPYANKKNWDIAHKTYKAIYDHFNLAQAQENFTSNPNNMA